MINIYIYHSKSVQHEKLMNVKRERIKIKKKKQQTRKTDDLLLRKDKRRHTIHLLPHIINCIPHYDCQEK